MLCKWNFEPCPRARRVQKYLGRDHVLYMKSLGSEISNSLISKISNMGSAV